MSELRQRRPPRRHPLPDLVHEGLLTQIELNAAAAARPPLPDPIPSPGWVVRFRPAKHAEPGRITEADLLMGYRGLAEEGPDGS